MKNKLIFLILISVLSFVHLNTYAQKGKVPPFQMVLSNNMVFKAQNLPVGKPIILIYFSTECDDCQHLTNELLTRIDDFKNVSFAMITYLSVESVSQFVTKNNLNKYSNIFVGTEGDYLFVKDYYNIEQFPFIALYNKDGELIKKYNNKEINLTDLSYRLKNL